MPTAKRSPSKNPRCQKDQADHQGDEHGGGLAVAGCAIGDGGFRPYAAKFAEVLGSLAEKAGEEASPLLVPKEKVKKSHCLVHLRPGSVRRFQHQPDG
jgi:hypothetical protein